MKKNILLNIHETHKGLVVVLEEVPNMERCKNVPHVPIVERTDKAYNIHIKLFRNKMGVFLWKLRFSHEAH